VDTVCFSKTWVSNYKTAEYENLVDHNHKNSVEIHVCVIFFSALKPNVNK